MLGEMGTIISGKESSGCEIDTLILNLLFFLLVCSVSINFNAEGRSRGRGRGQGQKMSGGRGRGVCMYGWMSERVSEKRILFNQGMDGVKGETKRGQSVEKSAKQRGEVNK